MGEEVFDPFLHSYFFKCLNNPKDNMLVKHMYYDDLHSSGALKKNF